MTRKRQHDFPRRMPMNDGMDSGDRESPYTDRLIRCAHCKGSGSSNKDCCRISVGKPYPGWGNGQNRCCSCSGAGKVRV